MKWIYKKVSSFTMETLLEQIKRDFWEEDIMHEIKKHPHLFKEVLEIQLKVNKSVYIA